jgi:uncharacterized protein (TIGR02001 family)
VQLGRMRSLLLAVATLSVARAASAEPFDLAHLRAKADADADVVAVDIAMLGAVGSLPRQSMPIPDLRVTPALAPWQFELSTHLVSDFRRGGVSLSNGKPTVQAEAKVEHRSGIFASAWASGVASNGGAIVEIDLAAGYGRTAGDVDFGIAATYYLFPGVANANYVELQGEAGLGVGPVRVAVVIALTPRQAHVPKDNLYVGLSGEWAIADGPVTLDAAVGHENGAFADHKIDWSISVRYRVGPVELRAAYVDTAHAGPTPHAGARPVLGIRALF